MVIMQVFLLHLYDCTTDHTFTKLRMWIPNGPPMTEAELEAEVA